MNTDGWIDCGLPYGSSDSQTFAGKGLNKPGTLIETAKGIFLIGHINPKRGICDDCVEFGEFGESVIVVRYRVIWEPPV